MPIWLRRFTFNQINEFYVQEKEEFDKAVGKGETLTNKSQVAKPGIPNPAEAKPTYTSKVQKK